MRLSVLYGHLLLQTQSPHAKRPNPTPSGHLDGAAIPTIATLGPHPSPHPSPHPATPPPSPAPASTARYMFTTFNYSILTFPPWEWFFVYDPDKGRAEVQLSARVYLAPATVTALRSAAEGWAVSRR